MPGSIDAGAVAKIHAACEEALADAAAASAPCCATLEAWRADVGTEEGAALYRDRRAANEAADRPRAVMDELKAEVLARRQEDMLSIIRSSPGDKSYLFDGHRQLGGGRRGRARAAILLCVARVEPLPFSRVSHLSIGLQVRDHAAGRR